MLVWTDVTWLNITINVLVGLWIGIHFFGFVLGVPSNDGSARMYRFAKMGGSAMLVLIALLFWLGATRSTPLALFSALLFFGMTLGFVGDLTLAGLLRLPNELLFGMLWFGVGHMLYIAAFLRLSAVLGLSALWMQVLSALGMMLIAALIWRYLVSTPQVPAVLDYGALGYGLLLAAMAGVAISVAIQAQGFIPLAVGAVLFLLSDMLLANVLFRKNTFPFSRDVVWFLYIVGQALIVFSNATALGALGT